MIAPVSRFLDWSAIQILTRRTPPADGEDQRLQEAVQFLCGPEFLPAESQPAEVEFADQLNFRFPTPRPCAFEENNVAHGRFYRCQNWKRRPVIILLHGQGDFFNHRWKFPLVAGACNRAGFNAITLTLPFHFRRRPKQFGELAVPNYLLWAQSMAQGIAEIRAFAGWLLQEGCPAVALWGISLGGWLSGLAACRDVRFAAAVLVAPGVQLNVSIVELIFGRHMRNMWKTCQTAWEQLNQTPLNLLNANPVVSRENILLIEGVDDLLVPKKTVEELWEKWQRPDIWRFPQGHIGVCLGGPSSIARVLEWLSPRLKG